MAFQPAPEPKTALGRRRLLAPRCGLRVSPLCLGAMSIGEAWKEAMGSMDKDSSFALLDAFAEAGGNFIDTANNYQEQESEQWLGEWMEKRGNRDEMVIATKYTTGYRNDRPDKSNYCGNHVKSMHVSVEQSLKKLKTSYIDILYLHWWDWTTPIEEVMQGLNNLVRAGKVLYLGISDSPAWVVSSANRYARDHGMAQFVVYQGKWSVGERDFEREILDVCRYEGMGLCPWNAMGGGKYQSKADREERAKNGEFRNFFGKEPTEQQVKISDALEKVAGEHQIKSVTAVALAYVLSKAPYVFPLVGGRKINHLKDNIQALTLKLTTEQIATLEAVVPFDVGFPKNFISADPHVSGEPFFLLQAAGRHDFVQAPTSIQHQ